MKNRKKKTKKKRNTFQWNFVLEAGPGCHIAREDLPKQRILEWEKIDPDDYDADQEFPDIAIDPDERTLTLCNMKRDYVVAYVTVYDTDLYDRSGELFQAGITKDNKGKTQKCTTFIVLSPPQTFVHLCHIHSEHAELSLDEVEIDSDVQVWNRHVNPEDTHPRPVAFPLQGGPFLCTQGVGGQLTHFFSGNLHAIDFRCPIGTPLLAVGEGTVVDVKDSNTLSGVAVSNLFQWNSILLELDDDGTGPLFVEYVHIERSTVAKGDRVQRGQVIGSSGSVGFSPEPHLHFAAYRSSEATAPTVLVHFFKESDPKAVYIPSAGHYYDAEGLQSSPTSNTG